MGTEGSGAPNRSTMKTRLPTFLLTDISDLVTDCSVVTLWVI